MLPTDKFFVPRDEILKLTKGSFEHIAARLETAVKTEKARLFENAEVQVLGTYPQHVVVLSDTGKVFSAKYEESAAGEMRLISAVTLDANIYPRTSMSKFLNKEARAVTDLYLKGQVSEAQARMKRLMPLVDSTTVIDDPSRVQTFASELMRTRLWRKLVSEQTDEVQRVLGAEFEAISSNKLRAKFSKLYDGSVSGADLEKYRGLVNEDLGLLMKRIEATRERTVSSVSKLREAVEKVPETEQETVSTFESFVNDFVEAVTALPGFVSEAISNIESVASLGKLYDTIADDFLRFELAGGFAVEMTNRLAAAS